MGGSGRGSSARGWDVSDKQFLKMADVFQSGAVSTRTALSANIQNGTALILHGCQAEYAAHAINSHDELVRLRDELLAALEAHEKFWTIREAELGELSPEAKAVRDNGLVAITAAKGTER